MSNQIIINATPTIGQKTGIGRVVSEICKRLDVDGLSSAIFYTPFRRYASFDELSSDRVLIYCQHVFKTLCSKFPMKGNARRLYHGRKSGQPKYDLYWEPNFIPLRKISAHKIVTTVHDMAFWDHPEWHPDDRAAFLRENFFRELGRSDLIVTVSEFSRQRLLEANGDISEDRVKVIYNGVDKDIFKAYEPCRIEQFRKDKRLPKKYILFVGTLEPRKNIQTLLSAFARLPDEFKYEYPLVIAGSYGWKSKALLQEINLLSDHISWLGYVPNYSELAMLYSAASVFVFPSLYEGFGLPPLEALACGTPVVLSDIPVFREVFADSVTYVQPSNAEEMALVLQELLASTTSVNEVHLKGESVSSKHTWEITSNAYKDLFSTLL